MAAKRPAVDYVARAAEYCRRVLSGATPACKYVRQACQRQLDDLARAESDPTWPYEFRPAPANRVCRFLEQLPHVKGPLRGRALELELWQCFVMTTVFGWVRRANGRRRFRRAFVEVPRGNGKSFLCSGVGLFGLRADDEGGAEVCSAATTTEQANITRGDAAAMLECAPLGPRLASRLALKMSTHAITHPASNSSFKALSRESKNQEGRNIHVALVDELHAHPTRETWDVVIMGAAKRTQSLVWAITTAGSDQAGICYEVRDGVVRMLDGGTPNDQLFGVIYTIDSEDRWQDESSWIKANPNWHASIDQDLFRMDAIEAQQTASKENNFKTKHLDVWCNADVAWMSMGAWDACADPGLDEAAFANERCALGVDLASKVDFAAKAKVFWKDLPSTEDPAKTERHYYLFVNSYLPEGAVRRSKNAQADGWVKDGWVRTTPGDVLDFDAIKEDLRADRKLHAVAEVAYDPHQATQLANEMNAEGIVMVEIRPNVLNFSAPMKELEALVLARRLHHDGNPAMRWMVSNTVCHRDAKENIYPRKPKLEAKIDGVVAAIMALNRAMLAPVQVESSLLLSGGLLL